MPNTTARWHISKAVDISNILAIISLVVGGVFFVNNFDKRITALEISHIHQQQIQKQYQDENQRYLRELREDIKYIRDRIDR